LVLMIMGKLKELRNQNFRNVFKYGKLYGAGEPLFEEGDVFKAIVSVPKNMSVKGTSEGRSKISGRINVQNDTEANRNDTEKGKSDTEKAESDTERIRDRVNEVVGMTVSKNVTEKVKQRLVAIIEVLIKTPGLKPDSLAEKLNVSEVTIKRDVQKIKDLVEYKGGQKTGGYYLSLEAVEKFK